MPYYLNLNPDKAEIKHIYDIFIHILEFFYHEVSSYPQYSNLLDFTIKRIADTLPEEATHSEAKILQINLMGSFTDNRRPLEEKIKATWRYLQDSMKSLNKIEENYNTLM